MLRMNIAHFLDYYKITNPAKKSIESLSTRLNGFYTFIASEKVYSPRDITYAHLRNFVADYKTPSVHIKKARIWSLRQFFHFLKLNGLIPLNIASQLPYPKMEKTVPKFLTADEYNQILFYFYNNAKNLIGFRNLVLIMLLGMLGLRLESLLSLNIENTDIETGLIYIKDKGQLQRTLFLPEILCAILSKYLKHFNLSYGPLFLSKKNKRISAHTLKNIFKQAICALGIDKKLHAHLFRHTAATYLNKVSTPKITQYILGHNRMANTLQYIHLNPDKYAVYTKCHPYNRKEEINV